MKKFLVFIAPFCVILFVLMWISCGLKGALIRFGIVLFMTFGLIMWMKFVDEHIKG